MSGLVQIEEFACSRLLFTMTSRSLVFNFSWLCGLPALFLFIFALVISCFEVMVISNSDVFQGPVYTEYEYAGFSLIGFLVSVCLLDLFITSLYCS